MRPEKNAGAPGQIERHDARGGAVRAHLGMIGEHDARTRKGRGGRAFHGLRVEPIVGGGEEDKIATDEAQPRVARGVDAAIVAMTVKLEPRHARDQTRMRGVQGPQAVAVAPRLRGGERNESSEPKCGCVSGWTGKRASLHRYEMRAEPLKSTRVP
jgi:hypothetical protein